MENEVFGAANVVPCELLVTMLTALDHAIQNVTHRLVDRVMCELEKGESICSLSTPEQIQKDDLYSVEIRRTVKIERMVRCKDCVHYNAGFECLVEGYGIERDPDWFCADGERKVQDADT